MLKDLHNFHVIIEAILLSSRQLILIVVQETVTCKNKKFMYMFKNFMSIAFVRNIFQDIQDTFQVCTYICIYIIAQYNFIV